MALIDKFSKEELEKIVQKSNSMKEVIDTLGYSTHSGNNHITVKSRLEKFNIDTSHFTSIKGIVRNEENVFIEDSTASQSTLRRWYKKGEYTPYICSICGQEPIWQGKELTLILDHINGHNHDDRLENLRWVCPNCNQQLDTTNGRNLVKEEEYFCNNCGIKITAKTKTGMCAECVAKSRRTCERPTREELKNLIRTNSFTSLGSKFGVSDKAITKWCIAENLPSRKKDINSYSDDEWELI